MKGMHGQTRKTMWNSIHCGNNERGLRLLEFATFNSLVLQKVDMAQHRQAAS